MCPRQSLHPLRVPAVEVHRALALAALLLALVACAAAQESPPARLAELLQQLARAETLDDEAVGDGGERSETFRCYERLRALATADELRQWTRHESPVVRGYAVRGLLDKGVPIDAMAIAREHLHDEAQVTTWRGCVRARQAIGDVVLDLLCPRLTPEQALDLAEALVREKSPLAAREHALRTVRFRDGMLHDLRRLAATGDAAAGVALARFRLAPDVAILRDLLRPVGPSAFDENAQFLAAAIHGDPALLPALRALLPAARRRLETDNANRLRFWLDAIASQRSEDAAKLLLDVLAEVPPTAHRRKDLAKTLLEVLDAHREPPFDAVRAAAERASRGDGG